MIVGIGAAPQTRLAEAAGLDVRDGVVTDASLRTSDPAIYAAGDIASAFHPLLGTHIRVEHWANALHQPQTAARGHARPDAVYDRVPYFYTDQYDLGMEYAGYAGPGGYDRVIFRGDVGKREFIAFWMSGGRVVAGMNVNIWDVNDAIQDLIRSGQPADPARLADPAVPLDEVDRPLRPDDPRDNAAATEAIPPALRQGLKKRRPMMGTDIRVRRVYEESSPEDGARVLVDRVWPRGMRKDAARLDEWAKDVAPSAELRTWYHHDPAKFDEFRRRYTAELAQPGAREALARLRALAADRPVTLLTATKDLDLSQAAVLAGLLRETT